MREDKKKLTVISRQLDLEKNIGNEGTHKMYQSNPIRKELLEFNKEKRFSVRDLFKR